MVNFLFDNGLPVIYDNVKHKMDIHYHINTFDYPLEHGHADYWEFTIILDGVISNISNGTESIYKQGDVIISTTRDQHKVISKSEKVKYLNFSVREEYLTKLLKSISDSLYESIYNKTTKFSITQATISSILMTLQSVRLYNVQDYIENNNLLRSALLILFSGMIQEQQLRIKKIKPWQQTIENLIQSGELIKYNVSSLCNLLGYSRTQLNHFFEVYYGTNPHDFLTTYKLEHSRILLYSTDKSVAEISSSLGYTTTSPFYIAFEKHYGTTPNEYRKSIFKEGTK